MILPLDSHIRNPPTILEPKQVVVFNAIRYSVDICQISYERLINSLDDLSENTTITQKDFPHVFSDVWSIINHAVIFKKIVCNHFQLSDKEDVFIEINKAKNLRDSYQHIDERISEILSLEDLPIYGFLTWTKNYANSKKAVINTIYSGTITNKGKVSIPMSNQTKKDDDLIIEKLEFTGVIRKSRKGEKRFKEESVLLTQLINNLKELISHFEKQSNEQLKEYKTNEKHVSDLRIQLFGCYND